MHQWRRRRAQLVGGALTLENVTIQNNAMPLSGGGVCHQGAGALTVLGSTIRNNVANGGSGGGIHDRASISMTIQNSFVLSNTVNGPFGAGGGVWTSGGNFSKQILTSTMAYNRADGNGGGTFSQATRGLQVFNSTVLSNTAGAFLNNPGNGGGIWSGAVLIVGNSQVLSNTALFNGTTVPIIPSGGGGIYQQSAQMMVGNSQGGL